MGNVIQMETIENLGRAAAECDLWAEQDELSYRERSEMRDKAAMYRARQLAILTTPQTKTATKYTSTGMVWAILGEIAFTAAILIGAWLWRVL